MGSLRIKGKTGEIEKRTLFSWLFPKLFVNLQNYLRILYTYFINLNFFYMKKKLFYLVVAVLAIAGFQAKAQTVTTATVVIATGDSDQIASLNNERAMYAGQIDPVKNKLVVEGSNVYRYRKGAPVTTTQSDRVKVSKVGSTNMVSFADPTDATNKLSLRYPDNSGGTPHDQFVVFRSDDELCVNAGYYVADGTAQPVQTIGFNGGNFEGFLAVNVTGTATLPASINAAEMLIVVHDKAGALHLMAYQDYVTSLHNDIKLATNQYFPLYIKTIPLGGRWAEPSDFADCKFYKFIYGDDILQAYNATATQVGPKSTDKAFSAFAVQQVDYMKDGDVILSGTGAGTAQATAAFEGLGAGAISKNYGTMAFGTSDSVIPLFRLSTPESNCQVLSVSRENKFTTQSQNVGVVGNKLEVRNWGEYYHWVQNATTGVYEYKSSGDLTCGTNDYIDYTTLQKFAIWIDEDGNMVLYPVGSYSWTYGQTLAQRQVAPDIIIPNSVLLFNDIEVKGVPGTASYDLKSNGVQIGYWNGQNTSGIGGGGASVPGYVCTAFNNLQTVTDFAEVALNPSCVEVDKDLSGRFYFLQVAVDTSSTWRLGSEFRDGGYNYGRDYVLATQIGTDGNKHLVVVPKEEIRTSETEYWNFPYDSVNMAAHWEVKAAGGDYKNGYILINMLGDTLQYNIDFSSATPSYTDILTGGYMPLNSIMPGNPTNSITQSRNGTDKYFGRPLDVGKAWDDVTNWFPLNPTASLGATQTWNTWKFHQLDVPYQFGLDPVTKKSYGQNSFFMELATDNDYSVGLNLTGWAHGSGNGAFGSGVGTTYWQQETDLSFVNTANLIKDDCSVDPLPACSGLMISLQPIYYVPTYGPFYPNEPQDAIINTGEPGKTNTFQKADSLTAYSFLEGNYDLTEAIGVQPTSADLKLGASPRPLNDGTGRVANQARLINTSATQAVQFIPLASPTGAQRNAAIKSTGAPFCNIDTLYGETYKWYLVKLGTNYLTYDTVNVAAATNRQKVGLTFDADLANATPVRLYQPLVGDKQNNNFLIQFYMPRYTYYPNATTGPKYVLNQFPQIESSNLNAAPWEGGGQVCFATIVDQTNYIYGVRAYTGVGASGTRFTWIVQPITATCTPNFIDPQWMGEERLLNLPLNNELWEKGAPVKPNGAWIANGTTNTNIVPNAPAAIVTNAGADKQTTLTHIFVTTIQTYSDDAGYAKVSISGTSTAIGTTWVGGTKNSPLLVGPDASPGVKSFETDLPVPLYNITNNAGLYLTVVPDDDMTTLEGATVPDVNGVKLAWLPKYTFATSALRQAAVDSLGYDIRALQLFAISGCTDGQPIDKKYGEFVYLPLASYQWDYSNNKVVTTPALKKNAAGKFDDVNAVIYNQHLGKSLGVGLGNDLRQCWRIAQFASTGGLEKNLVVFNSFNQPVGGNMTPIQVKWTKEGYVKPPCQDSDNKYMLVQKIAPKAANSFFFSINDQLTAADENTLFAHWLAVQSNDDEYMYTFAPEIQKVYDKEVGVGKAFNQTQLTGQYYFVNDTTTVNGVKGYYLAIDVAGYAKGDFTPKFDTLQLTCVGHDLPFFNFEKAGYDLSSPVAIIESFECDRTMEKVNSAYPEGIKDVNASNKFLGYRLLISLIDRDTFEGAKYLNIYAENRRELTPLIAGEETHVIPYYSFSIKEDGKEFFLNVDPSKDYKVNWDTITAAQLEILKDPNNPANENEMKYFKFCFPYKRDADGAFPAETKLGKPVHMQTLDTGPKDFPWLVNASLVTGLTTANQLNTAIIGGDAAPCLAENIYTVDYSQIDQSKANAWVFKGKQTGEQIWVPIAGLVVNDSISKTRDGALTTYNNGSMTGSSFVTKATDPDIFGKLMGTNLASNVTLVFGGRSMIGDWTKRPIWYYRIKLGDLYLTDATETSKDTYTLSGTPYFIAEFVDMIPNNKAYAQAAPLDSVLADKNFNQTFGFLYATTSEDPDQPFYIVSNANAFDTNVKSKDFRYLASVNERLVFVSGDSPEDAHALAFQWGNLDEDGYTNLQVVGTANIYGVDGGIKCVGTTGKVDIYSIDGRLIKSAVLTGSDQTIAAPRGIAIVKNGSKVVKVVVR